MEVKGKRVFLRDYIANGKSVEPCIRNIGIMVMQRKP